MDEKQTVIKTSHSAPHDIRRECSDRQVQDARDHDGFQSPLRGVSRVLLRRYLVAAGLDRKTRRSHHACRADGDVRPNSCAFTFAARSPTAPRARDSRSAAAHVVYAGVPAGEGHRAVRC